MKSDSEEARKGSNISLKINYNIKTVGKNIGTGLKLHHFAFKKFQKSCKGGFTPLATPHGTQKFIKAQIGEEYLHTHDK